VFYTHINSDISEDSYSIYLSSSYAYVEEEDFRKSLADAIPILERMCNIINGNDSGQAYIEAGNMPHNVSIVSRHAIVTYHTSAAVSALIDNNKSLLNKLDRHESTLGMTAYILNPAWNISPVTSYEIKTVLYGVKIFDGFKCKYCGESGPKKSESKHMLHPICQIAEARLKAKKDGLEPLNSNDEIIAVRSLDIEHKLIPINVDVYVPSWVINAIKVYHDNGGYAGMTLAEFLVSVRPDNGHKRE
jgi:hypothetical protein